ncbi:2,3-bisphosphoglycerate-dependent phosphoglycerate mutase [Halogranum amylolyticum]|uniref:2,3-bisphosphoglycerate-dependent phosphoglycerate mutase n=1 Tax=Halogranum amylolyticum TaxID=660520 RepID=A0A1H8W287_9EURY|nr:histidine phosphatase family protein [Halogranum amylolyticum]SEP21752.1 2,3-bisphosphoglycerate-dependent phosphoglycerate mutase [Halogranum amylolyticum]
MTTVYFVRHAQSPWVPDREAERPLSAKGRDAADHVATLLADESVDAVVSSPYRRAYETVEPVADRHGLGVDVDAGFRERRLTDGPVETIGETFESAVAAVWENWSFAWPDGESSLDAQRRGLDALDRVLSRYEGGTVVVGTHGQLLTVVLNHYDDRFDATFWRDELTTPDVYEAEFRSDELLTIERRLSP